MNDKPELEVLPSPNDIGANLSLDLVLSLLASDDGMIMMPHVNHHWFQGHLDVNVREIHDIYMTLASDDGTSMTGPQKEVCFQVFQHVDTDTNDRSCAELFYVDGKVVPVRGLVRPIYTDESEPFFEAVRDVKQQLNDGATIEQARDHLKKAHKFLIAPVDGLHRVEVVNHIAKTNENFAALKSKTSFLVNLLSVKIPPGQNTRKSYIFILM